MSRLAEPQLLEAEGLVKHFRSRPHPFAAWRAVRAVDGVSLAIARGETLAVVGESGCGKSTLGRLVLRLIEADQGVVRFDGQSVRDAGGADLRRLRRDMQIIFQDPFASLNPRMTAGDIVGEPLGVHQIASGAEQRSRARELLQRVGLRPDHVNRYPHEFSGGQRQRIGIARALASGPRFVVADEPVSALDVSIQAQVLNLLADIKRDFSLTLMFISHDLSVVRHVSDRVAVMYLGKVIEVARTEKLFGAPAHPYTRALLASVPVRHPAERRAKTLLSGDLPSAVNPPSGCRFRTRCPFARPLCAASEPVLAPLEAGHDAACHFAGEIAAGGNAAGIAAGGAPPMLQGNREKRLALYAKARANSAPDGA